MRSLGDFISECPSRNENLEERALTQVSNSEMSNFSQDQASGPQGLRPGGEIKGLRVPPVGREQGIPQIDAEIAASGS